MLSAERWSEDCAVGVVNTTTVPANGIILVNCESMGGFELWIAGAGTGVMIGNNGAGLPAHTISFSGATIGFRNDYDIPRRWNVQRIIK